MTRSLLILRHSENLHSQPIFLDCAGADTLLGPEMRSTGEVMGIDRDFSSAYAKAAMAAGQRLPTSGNVFITMTDKCKPDIVPVAKQLSELGFGIFATEVRVGAAVANLLPMPDTIMRHLQLVRLRPHRHVTLTFAGHHVEHLAAPRSAELVAKLAHFRNLTCWLVSGAGHTGGTGGGRREV